MCLWVVDELRSDVLGGTPLAEDGVEFLSQEEERGGGVGEEVVGPGYGACGGIVSGEEECF